MMRRLGIVLFGSLLVCAPANAPSWHTTTYTIWSDMESKSTLQELKHDVAKVRDPHAADLLTVIDDTLTVLEDNAAFSSSDVLMHESRIHVLVHVEEYDKAHEGAGSQ